MKKGKVTIGHVGYPKKGYINIRIDRESIYGNPYSMRGDENLRDTVCDYYKDYFNKQINIKDSPIALGLDNLIYQLNQGKNINLMCWCKPKRCHGETIKDYLEGKVPPPIKFKL